MEIVKPTNNMISLTTANTVYNSLLVFLSTTATAQINVNSNTGVSVGSFVIPANQFVFVPKLTTDTITSNVAVFATPVAYRG